MKKNRVQMIPFYDTKGEVFFALPSNMTIKRMVELGLPTPRIVPKEWPQAENEVVHPKKNQ